MVDVPVSPVRQPPHQRLPRSSATSARLVPVLEDSSSLIFAHRTRQKPSQTHALEPTGSRKLLIWPPWHGDCFLLRNASIPRCIDGRINLLRDCDHEDRRCITAAEICRSGKATLVCPSPGRAIRLPHGRKTPGTGQLCRTYVPSQRGRYRVVLPRGRHRA